VEPHHFRSAESSGKLTIFIIKMSFKDIERPEKRGVESGTANRTVITLQTIAEIF
jgi:hypothetical protein